MRDQVIQDALDRRRFDREFDDASLHQLTYNLSDWKASEKHAFPRERIIDTEMDSVGLPRMPSRGANFAGAESTRLSRPCSNASSELSAGPPKPQQTVGMRVSKVLNTIPPAEWADIARGGAPQAWQVSRQGTKKGNTLLRKELAHITLLRDQYRRSGARSTPLFVEGVRDGIPANLDGASHEALLKGSKNVQQNSSRFSLDVLSRPTTQADSSARGGLMSGTPVMTPNTLRKKHRIELFGTESRPSTVYQILKRRQPMAEFEMLWTGGPKGRHVQNVEDEAVAEKRAANSRRRALIKQLRQKMQAACRNTKTLPRELWDKFKTADDDGSGRLEFDEYCQVMEGVGLGVEQLGMQGMKTLYRMADKDGNGNIDFNEFLVAVVGNLVTI